MTLARKVARLTADGMQEGTAWLISDDYALTALHCVHGSDGIPHPDLSLAFYGHIPTIEADIIAFDNRIDVALLKLKAPHPRPNDFIISLSRSQVRQHDDIGLYGHPATEAVASPGGSTVLCKVVESAHAFRGAAGQLEFDAISLSLPNFTTLSVAGKPSSGLKGVSGCPVTWNDGEETAVGLVVEDGLGGNSVFAVPIAEIASCFPEVAAVLSQSSHVDKRSPRILLELTSAARVRWSGTIDPCKVGELWNKATGPHKSLRLISTARLRELGPLGKALVRLFSYSELDSLTVPDGEAWTLELRALEKAHRAPDTPPPLSAGGGSATCPAAWQEYEVTDLASHIHRALDSRLLALLSDDLHLSLYLGKFSSIGGRIEQNLRLEMWAQWLVWQAELEKNPDLLQHFFGRIFEIDAEAKVKEDNFASVGCCIKVREQLFQATLLALSLGAAGVSIAPAQHRTGNVLVAQRAGHACGVETRDQTALRLFATTVPWKSDVVFLPYLQTSLRQLCEKTVSMTNVEGTYGHALSHTVPIALTTEPEFLTALSQGASSVRAFYDCLDSDRNQRLAAVTLPSRTEKLDA